MSSDDKIMNGASYAGAAVSVLSGLTLTEWGIVVGIVTALLTFLANMYYQHQKNRRGRQLNESQLRLIELQERLIYGGVATPERKKLEQESEE